jgi:hypothetical protein
MADKVIASLEKNFRDKFFPIVMFNKAINMRDTPTRMSGKANESSEKIFRSEVMMLSH